MRLTFETNEETNEEQELEGSSFLAYAVKSSASVLGASMLGETFLPSEQEQEKAQLWGNYRGTRYLIVSENAGCMVLSRTIGGKTITVSSCNVSDVSTDSTTREVICPGNNQCRREGLRQGPYCVPIKPSEGLLRYPHPI